MDKISARSCSLWQTLRIRSDLCKTIFDKNRKEHCFYVCRSFYPTVDLEFFLNSLPLSPISNDVSDQRTSIPAMIVIGKEMQCLPITVPPLTRSTIQPFEPHPAKWWACLQRLGRGGLQRNEVLNCAHAGSELIPLQCHLARIVEVYLCVDRCR